METSLKGELTDAQKAWFKKLADHEIGERELMDQGIPYRYLESWDPVINILLVIHQAHMSLHQLSQLTELSQDLIPLINI